MPEPTLVNDMDLNEDFTLTTGWTMVGSATDDDWGDAQLPLKRILWGTQENAPLSGSIRALMLAHFDNVKELKRVISNLLVRVIDQVGSGVDADSELTRLGELGEAVTSLNEKATSLQTAVASLRTAIDEVIESVAACVPRTAFKPVEVQVGQLDKAVTKIRDDTIPTIKNDLAREASEISELRDITVRALSARVGELTDRVSALEGG